MANQLSRSKENRVLGGVCGGLAEYFDVPVILLRIIFLILFFAGGGILIYLIMWIAMPDHTNYHYYHMENQEPNYSQNQPPQGKSNSGSILAGVVLISLGAFFLVREYIPDFDFSKVWPYILIAAGVFLLLKGMQRN